MSGKGSDLVMIVEVQARWETVAERFRDRESCPESRVTSSRAQVGREKDTSPMRRHGARF